MATAQMVTFIITNMAANASCLLQLPSQATWVLAPTSSGPWQNGLTIMPSGNPTQFTEVIFTPTTIYLSGASGGATSLSLKTWVQTDLSTVNGSLTLSSGTLTVITVNGQNTYQAGSNNWAADLSS